MWQMPKYLQKLQPPVFPLRQASSTAKCNTPISAVSTAAKGISTSASDTPTMPATSSKSLSSLGLGLGFALAIGVHLVLPASLLSGLRLYEHRKHILPTVQSSSSNQGPQMLATKEATVVPYNTTRECKSELLTPSSVFELPSEERTSVVAELGSSEGAVSTR